LMRRGYSPHRTLVTLGGFVAVMVVVFGILSPIFHIFSLNVPITSVLFTIVTGVLLSAGLFALGKFATFKVANFAVAFLAIQCLLNSLSDLKTVFFINAPLVGSDLQNDASNMAAATGIPGILWVLIWIVISVIMISVGMRFYAIAKDRSSVDSVFED